MVRYLKKIFSIFLIFNLTFVTSVQASTSFVDSFSVTDEDTSPSSVAFNNDGTKMFVVGRTGDDVNEYTLSIGFDLTSTINFVDSFSVTDEETIPQGVAFNNDGTKMFVTGRTSDAVHEYTLSTGFDLRSTVSLVDSFSVTDEEISPTGVTFNNDGTKMFVIGFASDNVNEYTLSIGFDLTSTINFVDSFSVNAQDTAPQEVVFNNDGTKMFVVGEIGDNVYEYTLTTGFDVSSATFLDSFSVSDQDTTPTGVAFNNDGTKMFVVGSEGDDINEYTLSTGFDLKANPNDNKDVKAIIDAQVQLAKENINRSIEAVSSRLSYLRANRINDNLSKNNIKLEYGDAVLTSLNDAVLISNNTKKSIIPDDWSSWSEGSISMTEIDNKTNSSKIDIETESLTVGFDKKLNNNDLLGFAVQYGQSDTDVGSNGSGIDSKNYNLSVYRTRRLEDDNFIEGLIGIGFLENDITRKSDGNTTTGSRKGNQLYGSVNYGKTIDKGAFNLTPTARVDVGYTELDAYSETGTNAISYDKQTVESGLASVGLAFDNIVKFNNNSLKPFGSIEYGYDFSNSSNVKMNYIDTGRNFTVKQSDTLNHLLSSEIGFEFIAKDNLNLTGSYKRTESDQDMSTDAIKFGLNFKSNREIEYAIVLDGSDEMAAGFNVVKNINGFDLNFNANQAFNETSEREAKLSLSSKF